MMSVLQLPAELWLQVFSFLSWRDKLSVRCTCSHFRDVLDKSRSVWRGFSVVLRHFSRYNQPFWRSLAQRYVASVSVCSGKGKHLKQLNTWLPALSALRLDCWEGRDIELKLFCQLRRLSITNCANPLKSVNFLFPLSRQLTQLSICNVQLTCPASHLLAAINQLTRLTTLLLHHDGSLRVPRLSDVLTHLPTLTNLSWTMISHKVLSHDFFSPARLTAGGTALQLSDLQLLNYDAMVTQEVLQPLSRLCSLSIFHLYSVPGPTCHLQTWLTSLPHLRSLNVHGGHPLASYADLLPSSLLSLTLCVDLQSEDLHVVSHRAPHLEHLHLEPWNSSSHLVRLLPQLFPHLRTLRIRHHHVSDVDFLHLQKLQHLNTLEILDSYHRPDPTDPSWVVYEPSPRLLQLISDLQKLTNHRVRVITNSHRDPLTCHCV